MVCSITAPGFWLEINQKKVTDEIGYMVEEIKLEDEVNTPALLTIRLSAFDYKEGQWVKLPDVKPGDQIKVGLVMAEGESTMAGDVDAVNIGIEQYDTMEIRAYDRLRRLQRGRQYRSFLNMSDSDLASQFASEAKLKAGGVKTTSAKHEYLFQNNQTNYQFLMHRAQRIGYEVMVDEDTLIFRPIPVKEEPVVTLEMDFNLESFKTQTKIPTRGSQVEVRGWNIKTKEIITAKADKSNFDKMNPRKKSGQELAEGLDSTPISIFDQELSDANEAELVAKAQYRACLWDFINGDGKCGGDPRVRAGRTVEIVGANKYDGKYYIVSTVHTMDREQGYTTTFKVKGTEL